MADTKGSMTGYMYRKTDKWCPILNDHCRDDCAWYSKDGRCCVIMALGGI